MISQNSPVLLPTKGKVSQSNHHSLLSRAAIKVLDGCLIVVLLKGRKASAPVILRSTASLLIAKVLAGIGREETC